jgi:hypothetical protein
MRFAQKNISKTCLSEVHHIRLELNTKTDNSCSLHINGAQYNFLNLHHTTQRDERVRYTTSEFSELALNKVYTCDQEIHLWYSINKQTEPSIWLHILNVLILAGKVTLMQRAVVSFHP